MVIEIRYFWAMSIFRISLYKNAMTLFTGLIFLNMSFFLAEVSMLKLNQDKKMIGNIAKLIASSSAEEEKDAFGGTDEDCSAKEVDLIFQYHTHASADFALISSKRFFFNPGSPLLGSYEIYSPPPEV
jgi:hypothetical protein